MLCSNPGDPVGVRVGLCIVYVRCSLVHNVINSTQQAPHTRSTQYRTPLRGRAEKDESQSSGGRGPPVEMVEMVEKSEFGVRATRLLGFLPFPRRGSRVRLITNSLYYSANCNSY